MMETLSEAQVERLLDPARCVAALEKAFHERVEFAPSLHRGMVALRAAFLIGFVLHFLCGGGKRARVGGRRRLGCVSLGLRALELMPEQRNSRWIWV